MAGDARNLVLVTADSLRADHCGFVDSASSLTPTIDRLADEGVSFTEAIAPGPRTPSSVPVLFTGEFIMEDGNWTMADWQGRQLRIGEHMARFTHLSERLQRRGYETAAFTANPWTTRESNFHLGFDDFTEISADSPDVSSQYLSDSTLFRLADAGIESLPGDPFEWSAKKEWFAQWTGFFELIRETVSELSEPFFLWVFIMDTHQPYITPRRFREESAAWEMYYSILRYWQWKVSSADLPTRAQKQIGQTYRDAVRSVDSFLDRLVEVMTTFDPVTVFLSDHGEALGEHGNFGHEQTLYEENLRVPAFVHNVRTSEEVGEQLPLRSLPELLVNLADTAEFDPQTHTRQFVVSQTENNRKKSVRTSRWKYIDDEERGVERLYDLRADPSESGDVTGEYPVVTEVLADVLKRRETTQAEKANIGAAASELLDGSASL